MPNPPPQSAVERIGGSDRPTAVTEELTKPFVVVDPDKKADEGQLQPMVRYGNHPGDPAHVLRPLPPRREC
jgi:hypothetical protein